MTVRTIMVLGLAWIGLFMGCTQEPQSEPVADLYNESKEPVPSIASEPVVEVQKSEDAMKDQEPKEYNELSDFEQYVILRKGTEPPNVGEYTDTEDAGTYVCRQCNAPLYKSEHKFHSNCGWPAFDDEIKGAVTRQPDADGFRIEIICTNCDGHLGHVFENEGFTEKNIRHCVNSVSMRFYPAGSEIPETITLEK